MGELINGRTPEEIKRLLRWGSFRCGSLECDECEYYENVCNYKSYDLIAPNALAYIEHLEAQIPKWISVRERLPDSKRNILTVNGHGVIRIMALWCYGAEKWKWIENGRFKYYNDITHWMSLPSTEVLE